MSVAGDPRTDLEHAIEYLKRPGGDPGLARMIEAALRRLNELEQEREEWLRQRWSFQNRAEVAERGHKAALQRDFEQRDEIKRLDRAAEADLVRAFDLHKERIRRLQEALCECPHREFFQADLHDEECPVCVIAAVPAVATEEEAAGE